MKMERKEILKIVIDSIREETEFSGEINESSTAYDIEGWDSLAHARIMFNIDIALGTMVEISQTHTAGNVGELASVFFQILSSN